MKRTFNYKDDKSDKFWAIETNGNSFLVTYGKSGTTGQTQTKTFADEAVCQKEADKLIAEKVKKGYVEGECAPQSEPKKILTNKETYEQLIAADDLHKALVEHFAYLADSPDFKSVLEKIMAKAESVDLADGNLLVIRFPDEQEMSCSEPSDDDFSKWPKSYRAVMAYHESITFPDDGGWALELCDTESLEYDMFEESDSDFMKYFDDPSDIKCPFTDYSDWWVYHPKKKNPQREPLLCKASHESCDIEASVTVNIGSLFLKRIAECLDLDDVVPDVEADG